MHPTSILRIIGLVCSFISCWMIIPLGVALVQKNASGQQAFGSSIALSLFLGITILLATHRRKTTIGKRDALILLPLIPIIATLVGAFPFFLNGTFVNFFDASFEALSGLTTTGISLVSDPSTLNKSIILWRAILQWLGGFSALILVIWALPFVGIDQPITFTRRTSEENSYNINVSLRRTIKSLATIYLTISATCTLFLLCAGLSVFDSVCYTMSTVSTGGFFVTREGPLVQDTLLIQGILCLFMIAGAMNFTLHGKVIGNSLGIYLRDPETQMFIGIILLAIAIAIITIDPGATNFINIAQRIFQLISVGTTTGYPSPELSSANPHLYLFILLILAVLGGTTGSTSGGFKVIRIGFLLKQAKTELIHLTHPHAVVPIQYGNLTLSVSAIKILSIFSVSYCSILVMLTVFIALFDINFFESVSLAITILTNSGPNITDAVGRAYTIEMLPWLAKLGLMIGMLIGRLEILVILVIFNYSFWRS